VIHCSAGWFQISRESRETAAAIPAGSALDGGRRSSNNFLAGGRTPTAPQSAQLGLNAEPELASPTPIWFDSSPRTQKSINAVQDEGEEGLPPPTTSTFAVPATDVPDSSPAADRNPNGNVTVLLTFQFPDLVT